MNKRKLERYEYLFQKMGPGQTKTTIEYIAEAFKCSDRHARTLLNQMTDCQWLTWSPIRGRGHKGELHCLLEPMEACYQQVDQAIQEERYQQAHQLLGFNRRDVASELKRYLECTSRQNEAAVYAPFHRKIESLHPHHATERTERHLIHEVFQTLVNVEGEKVVGNLAHAWKSEQDATRWTFYLCSSATFHDHTHVTAHDVADSLQGLVCLPYWRRLYDHVVQVTPTSQYSVVIILDSPDPHLPFLLSRSEASILSRQQLSQPKEQFQAIGSGPFKVSVHSDKLLRLVRHPIYSGTCARVEKIEMWIHPEWGANKKCAENFFFLDGEEDTYTVSTNEIGDFFMLFNHAELQSRSLKEALSALFQHDTSPNLMWPFPVLFTYENNNENRSFARRMIGVGPQMGHVPHGREVAYGHTQPKQDMTIGGIRREGDRITSLLAFFKLYPYWQSTLSLSQYADLSSTLSQVRRSSSRADQARQLDHLLQRLNEQNVLVIFQSEDLTLTVPSRVQGVEINSIGWCDFSKLWVQPD
ncbi:SgrR family transcriptional regulator [Vibrio neptunius]|uniref:SgrR family transcriptional regulator n=1 Tax=Vibrio neptunius TaxID=170651 RepID=UPI0006960940|nr:SgrR family transcriptional regulator [Vibrio neptunius]